MGEDNQMIQQKKRPISFAEWLRANAPEKDGDVRSYVREWATNPNGVEILDKYLSETLGDKWIAYKTLRRITR